MAVRLWVPRRVLCVQAVRDEASHEASEAALASLQAGRRVKGRVTRGHGEGPRHGGRDASSEPRRGGAWPTIKADGGAPFWTRILCRRSLHLAAACTGFPCSKGRSTRSTNDGAFHAQTGEHVERKGRSASGADGPTEHARGGRVSAGRGARPHEPARARRRHRGGGGGAGRARAYACRGAARAARRRGRRLLLLLRVPAADPEPRLRRLQRVHL